MRNNRVRVLIWKLTNQWTRFLTRRGTRWNCLIWDIHQFGVRQLVKHNERAMAKAGFQGFQGAEQEEKQTRVD